MYYELKWKDWRNGGEEWFSICYTKEQIEEEKEMVFNDPDHDFEYCGCLEVKEEDDKQ